MNWVKILNSMPSHPKLIRAGSRASWLYLCGICYANEHLTDGFLAAYSLATIAPNVHGAKRLAAQLVEVGLWHEVDGGWVIHDYKDVQRSANQIRHERSKEAERKAKARATSNGHPPVSTPDSTPDSTPESHRVSGSREEKRREELPTTTTTSSPQVARAKRATRRIDQSQPPSDFPADLVPAGTAVLAVLYAIWEVRGGVEPQVRGVALAMMRNPRADHVAVALKLQHWLTAGKGQRARCADVTARFGDWVADEHAVERGYVAEQPISELDRERLAAVNRITKGEKSP